MNSFIRCIAFCLSVFLSFESNAQQADTTSKKSKVIETVDFKSNKTVTITYKDGSSETMSETEANKKGLIHNGGYGNHATINTTSGKGNLLRTKPSGTQPLYVLDGKEITEAEMKAIDPSTIQSINVLKDKTATDKYGVKGKNGVIEISSKYMTSFTCGVKDIKDDSFNGMKIYQLVGAKESDEIVSFNLSLINEEGDSIIIPGNGTRFTANARMKLNTIRKHTRISFENIYIKRNGSAMQLPTKTIICN